MALLLLCRVWLSDYAKTPEPGFSAWAELTPAGLRRNVIPVLDTIAARHPYMMIHWYGATVDVLWKQDQSVAAINSRCSGTRWRVHTALAAVWLCDAQLP
jgi:hypothetical protein